MFTQPLPLVQQALLHFNQGKLADAASLLTKALSIQPRHFDALHLLGVVRAMEGSRHESIELFKKAIGINKNHGFLQFNYAKALSDVRRDDEALLHHKRATSLMPDHADAWLNFGISLHRLGQDVEAIKTFKKALEVNPRYAAAWSNLGMAQHSLGQTEAALESLHRATELAPDFDIAYNNLGTVLKDTERTEEAMTSFNRAIELSPQYSDAWYNKGILLAEGDQHSDAILCFDRAIQADSNHFKSHSFKASSLVALGDKEGALAHYQKAIEIQPDYAIAHTNLAQLMLEQGYFNSAWDHLEYRWSVLDEKIRPIDTRKPKWDGNPSDQPLLLWGEQGIGDQILYGSILPELETLPQRKMVALDKRLISLFQRSMPSFDFVNLEEASDAMNFAAQLPLGSLPRLYRTNWESFGRARNPYLLPDKKRSDILRECISNGGKLICGVSWSSNRKVLGKQKSVRLIEMLRDFSSSNLHFVDLQYGDTSAERAEVKQSLGIEIQHIDEIDNFNDIDGLAALIAACDVVLCTSNSTAHLAAALGKKVLLLLPIGKSKIWYWSSIYGRNPWYPSVQPFIQESPGKWDLPLRQLKLYLDGMQCNN